MFEINSYLENAQLPEDMIQESESVLTLADLEQHFRACLVKINTLPPRKYNTIHSSQDTTFQMSIEKKMDGYPEKIDEQHMDWMPTTITYHWKDIIPLKSVPMDLFRVRTRRLFH